MKLKIIKTILKNSQYESVEPPAEMVLIDRDGPSQQNNIGVLRCRSAFNGIRHCFSGYLMLIFIICCTILFITLIGVAYFILSKSVHIVVIDGNKPLRNVVGGRFLSIAIDSSLIAEGFKDFDFTNKKLNMLLSAMAPAYLRIGGTMADRLYFIQNNSLKFKTRNYKDIDGGSCAHDYTDRCDVILRPNFTMSGDEWLALYHISRNTGLSIIFDLNVLIRNPDGSWDFRNAKELLDFSAQNNMDVQWELGNEPNAFRHVFNYQVNASQLALDFLQLRGLLDSYELYKKSLLVGPDVTRPMVKKTSSIRYLREFLVNGGQNVVDAVTWHQYYLNARTATPSQFMDIHVLSALEDQISALNKLMDHLGLGNLPLWLGETGSAFGGGADGLSNRFIGTFMWLDKLGVAAKHGIKTVIRQSFVKGYYALVDDYEPNPDFWVSVIYKMLVGPGVINCNTVTSPWVRIYCHCASKSQSARSPAITIFALNLQDHEAYVRIQGQDATDVIFEYLEIDSYIMTGKKSLFSREILLNDEELRMTKHGLPQITSQVFDGKETMVMPPYSLGFWVVRGPAVDGCSPNIQ